jgi:hypothetical protein
MQKSPKEPSGKSVHVLRNVLNDFGSGCTLILRRRLSRPDRATDTSFAGPCRFLLILLS